MERLGQRRHVHGNPQWLLTAAGSTRRCKSRRRESRRCSLRRRESQRHKTRRSDGSHWVCQHRPERGHWPRSGEARGPSSISIDNALPVRWEGPLRPSARCRHARTCLAYAESLVARPIEFQSCFISYASADQNFASQLRSDLWREQIRCWFAPEDLKIGDRFRKEIDRSIQLHDRLLVVLSAASLASAWVEDEVEAALERERNTGSVVLFPVRIDDAVMTTGTAWAASLRRTRHICGFRKF